MLFVCMVDVDGYKLLVKELRFLYHPSNSRVPLTHSPTMVRVGVRARICIAAQSRNHGHEE